MLKTVHQMALQDSDILDVWLDFASRIEYVFH